MEYVIKVLLGFFPYASLFSFNFQSITDINNFLTAWTVLFIQAYFGYSIWDFNRRLKRLNSHIVNVTNDNNANSISNSETLLEFWNKFKSTFVNTGNGHSKTSVSAEDYFDETAILTTQVNLRYWNTVPSILVGLGILGTFVGLTTGIAGFDISSTDTIKRSISTLLAGMNTAFATSVWGMLLSMLFSWREKKLIERYTSSIGKLCKRIDSMYKMSREEEHVYLFNQTFKPLFIVKYGNEEKTLPTLLLESNESNRAILRQIEELSTKRLDQLLLKIEQLGEMLIWVDDQGNRIVPANVFRDLLINSEQQTRTLKAFSTDLADGIKLSTDTVTTLGEALSNRLQDNLSPMLTSLNQTIDKLPGTIGDQLHLAFSPYFEKLNLALNDLKQVKQESSTTMIELIIDELKGTLTGIIDKFNSTLSSTTTSQLSDLAAQLGSAGDIFKGFPAQVQSMLTKLEESSLTQQQLMQEMTEKLSSSTSSTIQSLQEAIEAFQIRQMGVVDKSIEKLQERTSNTALEYQVAVDDSIQRFASIVSGLQSKLNEVIDNQNELIEKFKLQTGNSIEVLSRGTELLTKTNQTLNSFAPVITKMSEVSSSLNQSSGKLSEASSNFDSTSLVLKKQVDSFLNANQNSLTSLNEAMTNAKQVSVEFARQFKVINEGLVGIFEQIQTGLTDYRDTTHEHVNSFLEELSKSLTNAVGQLRGAVSELSEVVEDTQEIISKLRK